MQVRVRCFQNARAHGGVNKLGGRHIRLFGFFLLCCCVLFLQIKFCACKFVYELFYVFAELAAAWINRVVYAVTFLRFKLEVSSL